MDRRKHNAAITAELLEELGYDPNDVRDTRGDGRLEVVHVDEVILTILDRNERGGLQLEWKTDTNSMDAKTHKERVKVDSLRLAQYQGMVI